MPHAVFLRAVNVGGHKLKPKELADSLRLVNIGAAGTYVSNRKGDIETLRRAIAKKIPYETTIFVCEAEELLTFVRSAPFGGDDPPEQITRYVTILEREPATKIEVPIIRPPGDLWEVHVQRFIGRFALSLAHRRSEVNLYPNQVLEKHLKVPATTRNWATLLKVAKILEGE